MRGGRDIEVESRRGVHSREMSIDLNIATQGAPIRIPRGSIILVSTCHSRSIAPIKDAKWLPNVKSILLSIRVVNTVFPQKNFKGKKKKEKLLKMKIEMH